MQAQILSYDNRVRFFWTLIAILGISLIMYVVGVNSTIHNTVTRQRLEASLSNLTLDISEKEFSYINLKNKINIDIAYARGYTDVTKPIFITRGSARSLTYNSLNR